MTQGEQRSVTAGYSLGMAMMYVMTPFLEPLVKEYFRYPARKYQVLKQIKTKMHAFGTFLTLANVYEDVIVQVPEEHLPVEIDKDLIIDMRVKPLGSSKEEEGTYHMSLENGSLCLSGEWTEVK